MIRLCLITIYSVVFCHVLPAQNIVKGFVTDFSNEPIPFAAVYLSKTTIGTMTGKDGSYTLTIPQEGEYELISSFIGYKSSARVISAEGKRLTINIKLAESPILLNEITVKSKDRNRERNYALFNKLFLGETVNALNCKILNPEDLYLYREPNSNLLKGQSRKLFVQLDRNIYKPGDTIFFQAYVRDKFTGNFDSKSASLYALLTNEKRILVDSSRYKIDYSTASGWIPIPVNAELGKYQFAAFTSQMQNGDPVEAF